MNLKFKAGDSERLYNFVKNLNKNDNIALISHIDLDGITAAKVTNEILNTKNLFFLDYSDLNEDLVNNLKKLKVNKVVFTDLNFTFPQVIKEIEKFAKILIIDHHLITEDYNSDRTVFINIQGLCAGYLCYYLFSKFKNLEKWDWLVACSNLSDWLFMNNQEWLKKVYLKYGDKFKPNEIEIRRGKFWDLQNKLSLLLVYFKKSLIKAYFLIEEDFNNLKIDSYTNKVENAINKFIEKFKNEKQKISDGYFWEIKHESKEGRYISKSLIINRLSFNEPNKTFIIAVKGKKYYRISSRRQDKKYNMPELMKNLIKDYGINAGGHTAAAGALILCKDIKKFKENLFNWKN